MSRAILPLAEWELRFEGDPGWEPVHVPGCWETPAGPKDRAGPAWYRRQLHIPPDAAGRRIWLEFDGVSYDCAIFLDGQPAGSHTGLWDAFQVDLTGLAAPGAAHELLVRVEKPAGLTAGPDSPSIAGRFPLRSTLSGFLPYVWGQIFGGIWQEARLCIGGPAIIAQAQARGTAEGQLRIEIACAGPPAALTVELLGPDGAGTILETIAASDPRWVLQQGAGDRPASGIPVSRSIELQATIEQPRPWSPADPARYTVRLGLEGGDERTLYAGLRTISVAGSDMLLNGRPLYLRQILSWGWYNDLLHCNPGPARVREEFERLQSLGYNGVKLCLWFPPQYYFEIADQLGMLLWVELPMWLPQPDAGFHAQVTLEYERMVRQSCVHPSVILYTLGCELNRAVGPELLGPLYAMVKRLAGDALVRDNSGSGEAYGGLLNEFADFYDYHFYSDLHFFRPLVDYFTPRWRPLQPWVFGEFCDLDTFRDPARLRESADAAPRGPWWMNDDPSINPQGARWQFDLPFQEQRLRDNGLWGRRAEFERLSHAHGLLHRKWTIEAVRQYREIGGYVITGEVDTPISTAGMWDDQGQLKFEPEAFRAFNSDLAVLVGWDKRRAWLKGGDRAAHWDTWSYRSGMLVRPHLVASHFGRATGAARARWSVAFDGEPALAAGEVAGPELGPGALREVGVAEFIAPRVTAPRRATLQVELTLGAERATNSWPLWFFPERPWDSLAGLALDDPGGALAGLERLAPRVLPLGRRWDATQLPGGVRAVIATTWSPELAAFVQAGGRALLAQGEQAEGPLPAQAMPFWREALRVAEPHPAWGDFPHGGWAGLQFFGCAADYALALDGHHEAEVLLRRVDTRTMATHAYIARLPLGLGHVIASTLRFGGGHGEQPAGIERNTAAAHLLACLARSLTAI